MLYYNADELHPFIWLLFDWQRRKLDAVYNYIRSLAASNPFITARESLMSLFDDVRKKVSYVAQVSCWFTQNI